MKCKDCKWDKEKERTCFVWRAKGYTGCNENGPVTLGMEFRRLLSAIWHMLIGHAGTCKDEYGTRKDKL